MGAPKRSAVGVIGYWYLVVWLMLQLWHQLGVGVRPGLCCRSCLCALPQLSCQSPIRVSAKKASWWSNTTGDLLPPLLTQNPPAHPSQPNPGLHRGLPDPDPAPPHGTDRPALSSPSAPRYGLRLPGCNLVTARPAGWKVGLGSGSTGGCLWKPHQGR